MPDDRMRVLLLDAMGVLYRSCDDVEEILLPYLARLGVHLPYSEVMEEYLPLSRGLTRSEQFWRQLGLSKDVEENYLMQHQLTPGLHEFLRYASARFARIYCLSNDVSEWSKCLRERFGLEKYVTGWFVSGDLGYRKPEAAFFECVLGKLNDVRGAEFSFVDDNPANLHAIRGFGVDRYQFIGNCTQPEKVKAASDVPQVTTLSELRLILDRARQPDALQ